MTTRDKLTKQQREALDYLSRCSEPSGNIHAKVGSRLVGKGFVKRTYQEIGLRRYTFKFSITETGRQALAEAKEGAA